MHLPYYQNDFITVSSNLQKSICATPGGWRPHFFQKRQQTKVKEKTTKRLNKKKKGCEPEDSQRCEPENSLSYFPYLHKPVVTIHIAGTPPRRLGGCERKNTFCAAFYKNSLHKKLITMVLMGFACDMVQEEWRTVAPRQHIVEAGLPPHPGPKLHGFNKAVMESLGNPCKTFFEV